MQPKSDIPCLNPVTGYVPASFLGKAPPASRCLPRGVAVLRPENSRRARRIAVSVAAVAAAVGGSVPAHASAPSLDDLAGHPYRHGLVQTIGANDLPNLGLNNLSYGGGTNGVGVTTGAEKVYLVFWGSQW